MARDVIRIGLDLDGVIADWDSAFAILLGKLTGRACRIDDPSCWDWPSERGYTKVEQQQAWQHVADNPSWWYSLKPYAGVVDHLQRVQDGLSDHDVYFITARRSPRALAWTAFWLEHVCHFPRPSVLCTNSKGLICRALGIQAFLDDKFSMAEDVKLLSPKTRTYLRQRPHNALYWEKCGSLGIILTPDLESFLTHELHGLYDHQ